MEETENQSVTEAASIAIIPNSSTVDNEKNSVTEEKGNTNEISFINFVFYSFF